MNQHDTILNTYCDQIQKQGYCVVPNIIPTSECSELRSRIIQAVDQYHAKYETGRDAANNGIGFVPSLINHEQSYVKYLLSEPLNALMRHFLGEHLRVSFTSAIINYPLNPSGDWHADWPFNQRNAGRIRAPYSDLLMHMTTLWMLSPFDSQNGATRIVPGSHRCPTNPTIWDAPFVSPKFETWNGKPIPHPQEPIQDEVQVNGKQGSVLVMDSRLWHATASNQSASPRVALAVRYAPWWLNLQVLRPDSDERQRMCDESGLTENMVPSIRQTAFAQLPDNLKPLYRHWVE